MSARRSASKRSLEVTNNGSPGVQTNPCGKQRPTPASSSAKKNRTNAAEPYATSSSPPVSATPKRRGRPPKKRRSSLLPQERRKRQSLTAERLAEAESQAPRMEISHQLPENKQLENLHVLASETALAAIKELVPAHQVDFNLEAANALAQALKASQEARDPSGIRENLFNMEVDRDISSLQAYGNTLMGEKCAWDSLLTFHKQNVGEARKAVSAMETEQVRLQPPHSLNTQQQQLMSDIQNQRGEVEALAHTKQKLELCVDRLQLLCHQAQSIDQVTNCFMDKQVQLINQQTFPSPQPTHQIIKSIFRLNKHAGSGPTPTPTPPGRRPRRCSASSTLSS